MKAVPFYVHCFAGDADAALADLNSIEAPLGFLHLLMAGCLVSAGRREEAMQQVAAFEQKRSPDFSVSELIRCVGRCLGLEDDRRRLQSGMMQLGLLTPQQ
jgi:hypothetical protein